jgi:hypothetical protein
MRFLLRLYPRAWRRRYRAEMEAMLDELPLTPRGTLDLAMGVVDAHLHPPHESRRRRALLRVAGLLAWFAALLGARLAIAAATGLLAPVSPLLAGAADAVLAAALAVSVLLWRSRLDRRLAVPAAAVLAIAGAGALGPALLAGAREAVWAAALAMLAVVGRRRRRPHGPDWDDPAAGARVPRRRPPEPDEPLAAVAGDRPSRRRPPWPPV